MKKKVLVSFLILMLYMTIHNVSYINATSNLKQYTYATEECNFTTDKFVNIGTYYYAKPSTVYDFFDEDNRFNSVYTSEGHVYWSKFDENMNITETIKMDMFYDMTNSEDDFAKELLTNFGNAIYYNEHLFVVYGREHFTSSINDTMTTEEIRSVLYYPTMAIVKYDKQGNIVDVLEMEAYFNNYFTDWHDGTYLPFFPNSSCSLAINNEGILACIFGKTQFDSHQMSTIFFVDTQNLEWVSKRGKASEQNQAKYENVTKYMNSHSMGTRIISTSDGGYLFADSGDASRRGINIGTVYPNANHDILKLKVFRTLHYSEGLRGTHGYNNTFSVPGNLIEVEDGYLYIGSLEKTLSRKYGKSINESWNILVQKYKKDLYNFDTTQDIMSFDNVPVRVPGSEYSEYDGFSRLYLTGEEKDYGIKWLTDLKQKVVLQLKAVKIDDTKIAILWEEDPYTVDKYISLESTDVDHYYMIIDKDGNILTEKTKIDGIRLSTEEVYAFKDNKIYWTTTTGYSKDITVNVLDLTQDLYYIEHPDEKPKFQKGDINNDRYVNSTDAAIVLDFFKYGGATDRDFLYGDMNDDSQLNSTDAAMILDIFKSSNN